MNEETNQSALSSVKKFGKPGIAIVSLCVLACSIPALLALVGFGGLSVAASTLTLPPMIQKVGLAVGIIGLLLVMSYFVYRIAVKSK